MSVQPVAPAAESFYAAHEKIYPRDIQGRFARLRNWAVFVLLGLFYLAPWLDWNGRQAVLFDLPARKFYVLGLVMWPQDFIFLTWLLVILALSLFFFTAVAGRLWCGYACPQTVWTEVFLGVERFVEGDRAARMKLDAGPWNANRILRKGSKQFLWIALALWTGVTFVGFFSPIRTLSQRLLTGDGGGWEYFWALFYGFATYGNAGFLREQVCKYMCPYARFQSAMFDRDTLIITYDEARGEPRGGRRRGTPARAVGLGDCIDCTLCVQVCPTGIDIRKGLQYECIACAACIDACDTVMDHMQSPRGLIRYSTQHSLERAPVRIVRPRTILYGGLLVLLIAGFGLALALREPLGLDVIRDRNTLYRVLDDGRIEDVYSLRIINKTERAHDFVVAVRAFGPAGAGGADGLVLDPEHAHFHVEAGEVYPAALRVRSPPWHQPASFDLDFEVHAVDEPQLARTSRARFTGPAR